MPLFTLGADIINGVYENALKQFDATKHQEYKDFRDYYENNYDNIKTVIKKYYHFWKSYASEGFQNPFFLKC